MPIAEAFRFIEESVNHPDWLKIIEATQSDAVLQLAKDKGFDCTLDDLKQAAAKLLGGSGADSGQAVKPDAEAIDEAAAGLSDFQNDTGYSNDTGYAALYGVAGVILKM